MSAPRLDLSRLRDRLQEVPLARVSGRVTQVVGPLLEAELPGARLGALCTVAGDRPCEVVGFKGQRALLTPLGSVLGIAHGERVEVSDQRLLTPVGPELLGRVVDALGRPMDGRPLSSARRRPLVADASPPMARDLLSEPLPTGVRLIDGAMPLAKGQRVSIAAGSGVGKSTLLGMLARYVECDVVVVCLVGERGREVREFVEDNLGEEGLKRAVVVVATSDQTPAVQIKAPLTATTIAESFRDEGKSVLLLVDSLTRLALAQRQIGLAAGEPPTTKGYTPSVFASLAPLLERAGPGTDGGSISAIYTVLVEADDDNDPIADAVRGIVDGHIVLSRAKASRGHYPAIDLLKSLSRVAGRVASPEHLAVAQRLRRLLAVYEENEELVRLGAYRPGASAEVDEAMARYPQLAAWAQQASDRPVPPQMALRQLAEVVGVSLN
jgi:flagellum-specific ATP synthase